MAAVQGLTEFLPVSSSGHLIIARLLFNISDVQGTFFDAFLHLGTLLAVLVYFRRTWRAILQGIFVRSGAAAGQRQMAVALVAGTIPGGIAGFFLADVISRVWRSAADVALGLAVTAAVLLSADYVARKNQPGRAVVLQDAWYIGLAQAVALLPGISRSGITMAAGCWRGLSRRQAAEFSFLLSAPIIAGAGLSSLGSVTANGAYAASQLAVALFVSFCTGWLAIDWLLKIVTRFTFLPFAVYLLVLAGLVIFFYG